MNEEKKNLESDEAIAKSDLSSELGCALYIVGTHHYSFRSGEAALILGVTIQNAEKPRPCYHVEYADGKHDFIAIEDYQNYKLVMPNEIRNAYIMKAST